MKKTIIYFMLLWGALLSAQSFEYNRTWGTYYGPIISSAQYGTFINPINKEVLVKNLIGNPFNIPASYYNQFVTSGGRLYNNTISDVLHGTFNATGNIVSSQYSNDNDVRYTHYGFDYLGQALYYKASSTNLQDVGTPGAWMTTNPAGNTNGARLLQKESANGTLLWKTYIPELTYVKFTQDDQGNVYLMGATKQQGLGTAGTLQPNFQYYIPQGNTEPYDNGFIAKIGVNGNLVWATYFPAKTVDYFTYYNNHLYVVSNSTDIDPSQSQLATPNTWQTTKGIGAITKLDTSTGNRVWGTYFGNASTAFVYPHDIKVNATGIYLLGIEWNYSGTSTNSVATVGAHKPQITGDTDYFLTRLTLDGQRLWGTYLGSDDYELPHTTFQSLAITDNAVFVAGTTGALGNNIATPGAFVDAKPNSNNNNLNIFFAKFAIGGQQLWCSYYGGTGNVPPYSSSAIGIETDGNNTFYIFGATTSPTGISTAGTYQPQMPNNPVSTNDYPVGFLARFDLRGELSTSETNLTNDLQLYDNPNNGNFTLTGSVLAQQTCTIVLYDTSGRLIFEKEIPKQKNVSFNLEEFLTPGNYVLQINGEQNEKLKVFKMVVN